MTSEGLVFDDLTPVELPVSINGMKYVLREASGDVACRYRNAILKCTELGPNGKPIRIHGMADIEPLLISLCLVDTQGKAVSETTVRGWSPRVIKVLYAKVQEISDLSNTPVDEGAAKNVLSVTPAGSD